MENKFKIKSLTKHQIIISIDRLTRFKPTEEKYLRVYKDIITSNLIYPKFKKNELNILNYVDLTKLANEIFRFSLSTFGLEKSNDFSINQKLSDYENSVFKFDNNVQKLLDNKIDYCAALKLLGNDENMPINLRWLKSLSEKHNQVETRINSAIKFPLEKIIIAEGITEEILLPRFAQICGFDFNKIGIHLISAGGKNQVVKSFYRFSEILNLPIYVLLDNDAKENYEEIKPKMRNGDKVHILKCGEFEDLLPLNLIKRALNNKFKNFVSLSINDLKKDLPMTKILEEIFKALGLEFKKAEFAALIEQNLQDKEDISDEIIDIVKEINTCEK